ncbi:MAG: EF-hand domain-containing protein, partial [Chthoniobacteraceae bacterium]
DSKDEAAIAARKRLSDALAELNPAAGFKAEGSGRGDKTKKEKRKMEKKAGEKSATASETKSPTDSTANPPAPADAASAERTAKFDHLDTDRHGTLTLEEYKSRQSDPEAAAKRFEKFDVNKDDVVTREEYIQNGAKKLKAG